MLQKRSTIECILNKKIKMPRSIRRTKYIIAMIMAGIFSFTNELPGQTYTPVTVTGFNNDVFAETGTNASAVTSTTLDLSNYIMYTAGYAATNGLAGGVVNNGTIVNGNRTYQLAPYTGNNVLYLSAGGTVANTQAAGTVNLATPASFTNISLLMFSSEDFTRVNVVLNFTDGTNFDAGNFLVQDWFFGTGAMYSGFGRIARLTAPPYTVDGFSSNNPRFYPIDIALNCTYRAKLLQSITVTHVFGNIAQSRASLLAVSGVNHVPVTTSSVVTPANCGSTNGSIAMTITGGNAVSYSWNTNPVQTTATATNLAPGIYTCTITDAGGCTTAVSETVPGLTPMSLTATASPSTICLGETVTLSATSSGGTATNYSWQPGTMSGSTVSVSPTASTTYTVTAEDNGCPLSATVSVTVNQTLPAPVVTVSTVTATSITFNWNAVIGATAYLVSVNGAPYTTPSAGSAATSHTVTGLRPLQTVTIYVVAIGTSSACQSDPGNAEAKTFSDEIFIPNVFTPNGDGRNDQFRIYGTIIQGIEMRIFNQWGQMIYETKDLQAGWDGTHKGKMQPAGVYVFTARLTLTGGNVADRKGAISLIR